jgi:epidermal growth factor receptor substrate 15
MASPQQQAAVYGTWFGIADTDRDGAVAGGEAVAFFQRSGLDQMTLSQVLSSDLL